MAGNHDHCQEGPRTWRESLAEEKRQAAEDERMKDEAAEVAADIIAKIMLAGDERNFDPECFLEAVQDLMCGVPQFKNGQALFLERKEAAKLDAQLIKGCAPVAASREFGDMMLEKFRSINDVYMAGLNAGKGLK